ncbi:hypothetical protein A2533_04860 [Candidatus Falkowbacteria bacterium RIFOXYD2_FULL_35_9]|uniref:Transcriptional regulator n=1 Tax=Candidatus Falkowbacteria bacterium RIFOXYC2_FULL_36_12 TaxID=1798002 RepID=A0A1F5SYB1_9BACT|nr:MAG: hypothetical protein A2300_04415 [Candidatus Falkowbacteria bacterium RIFOXYB2_FULL_35_7]OGF31705.1 MAG: hypothetical protein A2478_04425 [Candidatus Falkowbacteria bacterium RIFOXYC2_FULL_36_12]OGF33169.1 MAG: hypothetical protein A2223_04870 [Candidatus Falkowbacteria bacterium RIFOXYA2_FULL_35_8]OGF46185.1 MAG: hypothetical protein A2533_04860 [Candidatus Falkowbacteria bacterium RIFOXYD2_FULL_35_9]
MLEQLFGSKTRVKLLKLFLSHPDKAFFVRELTRLTDSLINSIRRELSNLINIGFIQEIDEEDLPGHVIVEQKSNSEEYGEKKAKKFNAKKYYTLNKNSLFSEELDALFGKSKIIVEKKFAERIKGVGRISYLALSGSFIGSEKSPTDLIVIGAFEKRKIQIAVKNFEREIGKSIKYTIMDLKEYKLRRDIADRFLLGILENEDNLILVDDLEMVHSL